MSRIAFALEDFRQKYSNAKVGEKHVDITDVFFNTKCRNIKTGLDSGERVYALPVRSGKGMFGKWKLEPDKTLKRENGAPVIDTENVVPFLLCSPGTRFIGSDEIFIDKEPGAIQGVKKREARAVFEKLGLDPAKDAYALFARVPDEIRNIVETFKERLNGILELGGRWRPYFDVKSAERILDGMGREIRKNVKGFDIRRIEEGILKPYRMQFEGIFNRLRSQYIERVIGELLVQIECNIHPLIKEELANSLALKDLMNRVLTYVIFEAVDRTLRHMKETVDSGVRVSAKAKKHLLELGETIRILSFDKPIAWGIGWDEDSADMGLQLHDTNYLSALRSINGVFRAISNKEMTVLFLQNPKRVIDSFSEIANAMTSLHDVGLAFCDLADDKLATLFAKDQTPFIELAKASGNSRAFEVLTNENVIALFVKNPDSVVLLTKKLGKNTAYVLEQLGEDKRGKMTAFFEQNTTLFAESFAKIFSEFEGERFYDVFQLMPVLFGPAANDFVNDPDAIVKKIKTSGWRKVCKIYGR